MDAAASRRASQSGIPHRPSTAVDRSHIDPASLQPQTQPAPQAQDKTTSDARLANLQSVISNGQIEGGGLPTHDVQSAVQELLDIMSRPGAFSHDASDAFLRAYRDPNTSPAMRKFLLNESATDCQRIANHAPAAIQSNYRMSAGAATLAYHQAAPPIGDGIKSQIEGDLNRRLGNAPSESLLGIDAPVITTALIASTTRLEKFQVTDAVFNVRVQTDESLKTLISDMARKSSPGHPVVAWVDVGLQGSPNLIPAIAERHQDNKLSLHVIDIAGKKGDRDLKLRMRDAMQSITVDGVTPKASLYSDDLEGPDALLAQDVLETINTKLSTDPAADIDACIADRLDDIKKLSPERRDALLVGVRGLHVGAQLRLAEGGAHAQFKPQPFGQLAGQQPHFSPAQQAALAQPAPTTAAPLAVLVASPALAQHRNDLHITVDANGKANSGLHALATVQREYVKYKQTSSLAKNHDQLWAAKFERQSDLAPRQKLFLNPARDFTKALDAGKPEAVFKKFSGGDSPIAFARVHLAHFGAKGKHQDHVATMLEKQAELMEACHTAASTNNPQALAKALADIGQLHKEELNAVTALLTNLEKATLDSNGNRLLKPVKELQQLDDLIRAVKSYQVALTGNNTYTDAVRFAAEAEKIPDHGMAFLKSGIPQGASVANPAQVPAPPADPNANVASPAPFAVPVSAANAIPPATALPPLPDQHMQEMDDAVTTLRPYFESLKLRLVVDPDTGKKVTTSVAGDITRAQNAAQKMGDATLTNETRLVQTYRRDAAMAHVNSFAGAARFGQAVERLTAGFVAHEKSDLLRSQRDDSPMYGASDAMMVFGRARAGFEFQARFDSLLKDAANEKQASELVKRLEEFDKLVNSHQVALTILKGSLQAFVSGARHHSQATQKSIEGAVQDAKSFLVLLDEYENELGRSGFVDQILNITRFAKINPDAALKLFSEVK